MYEHQMPRKQGTDIIIMSYVQMELFLGNQLNLYILLTAYNEKDVILQTYHDNSQAFEDRSIMAFWYYPLIEDIA